MEVQMFFNNTRQNFNVPFKVCKFSLQKKSKHIINTLFSTYENKIKIKTNKNESILERQ
jgi:hypothetical protein